jgi:hypothetical protein
VFLRAIAPPAIEAERQGYAIDQKSLPDTTESLLGNRDTLLALKICLNPADPPNPAHRVGG